jgi:hypothetical protein
MKPLHSHISYHLRALYAVLPFYVAGFVLLGGAYKEKLSLVAVVFGWLMAQCANLMNTVSVCTFYVVLQSVS